MKTIVNEAKNCPSCGKPMPAGVLTGLCPGCLLAQGAETQEGGAERGHRFEPPPIEEVAKLFPQLEILGLLGAGGMGAVYKARQPALDRIVALKILPSHNAAGANIQERFNREARALARLSHPNIVAVFEFGDAGGLHYFIMEFVDGANLRQLEQTARLAPREALQIIPQICDALQYAHDEGVVHRDIKPENVLVDRKGRVKIADFGLAKILGQDAEEMRLTAEGQVMGTPHYMAPEQVEKPLTVDHRADIYSLGVVFYEMLTGDLPLGKFSPPSRKYHLDVRLDEVVLRALENDPARRYQHASEVKSQVESIAGTPAPAATPAVSAPEQDFIRWAGFPVVVERDGVRKVNRKATLQAFGILLGVLTIAFGIVTLVTGHSVFGWLGIAGSLSLQVRVVISAGIVAFGVWRALRSKPTVNLPPQTPQGTVILPAERFSRKAVVGACWGPIFFITAFLWVTIRTVVDGNAPPSIAWWQIMLNLTVLPLGLTAPFGTTILGWLAVADIRRLNGRLSGFGLAVFDGLFFPLLTLDGFIVWVCIEGLRWFLGQFTADFSAADPLPVFVTIGAVVICAVADFLIVRRVWQAVRLGGGPARATGDWWWSRRRGAAIIGVLCVVIIASAGSRRSTHTVLKTPPQQVAKRDAKSGTLVAKLPIRGTVELLAVSDGAAAANAWWQPDGTPIPDTLLELEGVSMSSFGGNKVKDMVLRWRNLPDGALRTSVQIEPSQGGSTGGGRVLGEDGEMRGGWVLRAGFPPTASKATVRIGFGLEAWQTVSTHDRNGNSSADGAFSKRPKLQALVHQITENKGESVVTLVIKREDADWTVRVIAVDTNGVEHSGATSAGTPVEKTTVWTYSFYKLPLAQIKEFQVQVRPVHWVEFREVALDPSDRSRLGKGTRTFQPTRFGQTKEVAITELFDFDKGSAGNFPTAEDGTKSYAGTPRNPSWMINHGFDADAGTNELRLLQMQMIDLKSDEWDTLTPSELIERMTRELYGPPRLPSTPGAKPPLTHGFRTRQGSYGLLQITGFVPDQPGVQLRYKLMERAHFE